MSNASYRDRQGPSSDGARAPIAGSKAAKLVPSAGGNANHQADQCCQLLPTGDNYARAPSGSGLNFKLMDQALGARKAES